MLFDEGKKFELTVGERTGDPASPSWFLLTLDKTLRKVAEVLTAGHKTITVY